MNALRWPEAKASPGRLHAPRRRRRAGDRPARAPLGTRFESRRRRTIGIGARAGMGPAGAGRRRSTRHCGAVDSAFFAPFRFHRHSSAAAFPQSAWFTAV